MRMNRMRIEEYQRLSTRTLNPELSHSEQVDNMVYGIVGEIGEVIDLLKKSKFQGHELDVDKLSEEIGDVMFYVANLCTLHDLDIGEILNKNHIKLLERYPDGFKSSDSINREA